MKRLRKKKLQKVGLPPGTLIYTGEKPETETKISIIDYNNDEFSIKDSKTIDLNLEMIPKSKIRWINLSGLYNIKLVEDLGNRFNLHPLVLEDILNSDQRPKYEKYEDYIFIVLKSVFIGDITEIIEHDQISFILGPNYVISFHEQESNIFQPIIQRIQQKKGRIRTMGPDYLLYALIDVITDNYFIALENIGEIIESLEDKLIADPRSETLQTIYKLKKKTIDIRKLIWPMRELIYKLQREDTKLIKDELQIYFRDIYDHIFRITDLLENYRDIIFGMLDLYLSSISYKMNDIMKVLTIISTIFIPVSFLTGFYGMNFRYMPELGNPMSYPIVIVIMIVIAALMLYFFKRKKWF
ncbi:MAG: magnesium/cobalt transporter CorA [Candidatus Lokiarchaeota archaeon]